MCRLPKAKVDFFKARGYKSPEILSIVAMVGLSIAIVGHYILISLRDPDILYAKAEKAKGNKVKDTKAE
jgi:hypothetical protein